GQEIEVESGIGEPFELLAAFDRIDYPPRGRNGGGDGAPGAVAIKGGARMLGKGTQLVRPGERLLVKTPGGGGLGPAGARDPALADQDRREGRS
ncbi:MAG TPA: hydantoinase B/oxoprolinase family protein, partial [Hyphomicrobiaceae bacterium]|nr:hydantoinase B/oxoprolinase family protein [Hyphomicrobiaceae bacterium]